MSLLKLVHTANMADVITRHFLSVLFCSSVNITASSGNSPRGGPRCKPKLSFTSLQHRNVQRLYGIDSHSIHRCLASYRWSASIIYRPFLIDLVTFPVISDVHRLSRMLLTCPAQVQFCLLICSTTSMILCEMVER